jgi:hypothetical protein
MARKRFWLPAVLAISALTLEPVRAEENSFAPLEVLDERLPSWLQFSGEYRSRWEARAGQNFSTGDDGYLLSRLWLTTEIKPTEWLSFVGQMQDSRVFFNSLIPSRPTYQNTLDIHQAYVQVGQREKGWADLRVGRQELHFGGQRLIGYSHWSNSPRAFDAVRVGLHTDGIRVDLFSSSVVQAREGVVDHHSQGDDLHGAYGSLYHLLPHAVLEPYFFWRLENARLTPGEISRSGHLDEKTFGFRLVGGLPRSWNYEMEMAKQFGSLGLASIHSWAGYWSVGRKFKDVASEPRPFATYNYASGDKNPHDRTEGTFDQLYPSGHDKLGLADQIGWRNIHNMQFGMDLKPGTKWTLKLAYQHDWLASSRDGLYSTSGTFVVKPVARPVSTNVGQELDFQAKYSWNSALELGVGYAHFFTGEFLNQTTKGKDFNYPYAMLTCTF